MVGSEVDHKYLGSFAKLTQDFNIILSAGLYKLLGLSTLLSRKLLRARKQRKLDPTRTTKSLDLYRHILWMAREGLTILQHDVLPELERYRGTRYQFLNELKVLSLKLNASFLHIFVLFDHTYQTQTTMLPNFARVSPRTNGAGETSGSAIPHMPATKGLAQYAFIAPTIDAFNKADITANKLLSGSHPLRLSVKLEYSAFTFDCTKDYETSRAIAQRAVDEAFKSMDDMDDESFEDAMELVGTLTVMSKRGLNSPSTTPKQQPLEEQQQTPPPAPPQNPPQQHHQQRRSQDQFTYRNPQPTEQQAQSLFQQSQRMQNEEQVKRQYSEQLHRKHAEEYARKRNGSANGVRNGSANGSVYPNREPTTERFEVPPPLAAAVPTARDKGKGKAIINGKGVNGNGHVF